ncbi:hypothetical protein KFD70_21770 [Bacillus pfraonensis]|uniref:hypothetical protein n=1 Tax=Bacillus pfraonensis TaxID=2830844 RepID=UPI003D6E0F94
MKRCIYLRDTEPTLSFVSEEHIFPAGIGGIQKLPSNYVSDQCNNSFSTMELEFMRNSLISLPRQFYGPGKRGSLNVRKATRSQICLMSYEDEPNTVFLGYMKLGQPFFIQQLKINANGNFHIRVGSDFSNIDQFLENFNQKLRSFKGRYILHMDDKVDPNEFVIGLEEDGRTWHVCLSNEELVSRIDSCIESILNQGGIQTINSEFRSAQVTTEQSLQFTDTYFRVCSKIVFNFLAFVKGQEFVLEEQFNPIREWIVNGGENTFANLTGGQKLERVFALIDLPQFAHIIMIVQDRNDLFGIISFYGGHFETVIKLSNQFNGVFGMDGFICDWKNRNESRFIELVSKRNESLNM